MKELIQNHFASKPARNNNQQRSLKLMSSTSIIIFVILSVLCIAFVIYGLYLCMHLPPKSEGTPTSLVERIAVLEQQYFTSEDYQRKHDANTDFLLVKMDDFMENIHVSPDISSKWYVGTPVKISQCVVADISSDTVQFKGRRSKEVLASEPVSQKDTSVYRDIKELRQGDCVTVYGTITKVDASSSTTYINIDRISTSDSE